MAHRILGIDVGSYSLKVAAASSGFRKSEVVDWREERVPAGPEPLEVRAGRTLLALVRELGWEHDVPYSALAGDALSLRVLEFPFHQLKRAELDKAVGAELEGQVPHDIDELVWAYDQLPRDGASDKTAGMRVLAVAATRERVAEHLRLLSSNGFEPHGVAAAPTAYAKVAARLGVGTTEPVLLVDHGHTRTNVCVLAAGRCVFARTLSRGGRNVTQAIARAWRLDDDAAERAKHEDGFVASAAHPAASVDWANISRVIEAELAILVNGLRQTLSACRAQAGVDPARVVLAGGAARLRGIAPYLAEKLELPVEPLPASTIGRAPADVGILAVGIALEGAAGRPTFDLRQGALAFRADFSFLRAKAGTLAACALVLLATAAGSAYASLYRLRADRAALDKHLAAETLEVFGQALTLDELNQRMGPTKEASPLPKMTAFDELVEISKHLPARSEGKIDVLELEIEPKKVTIKAVADGAQTIETIEKKLKDVDCFGEITSGRVDTVADGKQFQLTISSGKCM
jgi:type IV pilus assembly protein PilM